MAFDRLDIKELVKNAPRLPSLPAVALQIVRAANDPTTAAEDLSRLLSVDQSLAAKVLKMVNSSYYGARSKVSSIKQAVVILGFETVRSVALSAAVMDKFGTAESVEGFSRTEFWKHSLGVAMTARVIATRIKADRDTQETCYMAGLLHDIGKVILDHHFPESFAEILRRLKNGGSSFLAAEREVNAIGHDEIGAFLALQWGLPKPIINAIRHHHQPMEATDDMRLVDAVHFANVLVKTKGMGSGGDEDISGLSEDSVARLGILNEDVALIVEVEMDREFEGAKELIALLD
jgi:putative nucleotidyltransferase with HDIG domain